MIYVATSLRVLIIGLISLHSPPQLDNIFPLSIPNAAFLLCSLKLNQTTVIIAQVASLSLINSAPAQPPRSAAGDASVLWLASCITAKLAGPYRAGTRYALEYTESGHAEGQQQHDQPFQPLQQRDPARPPRPQEPAPIRGEQAQPPPVPLPPHMASYHWPSPQYGPGQPMYGYTSTGPQGPSPGSKRRRDDDVSELALLGLHPEDEGEGSDLQMGMHDPRQGHGPMHMYQSPGQHHHHHRLPEHGRSTKLSRHDDGRGSDTSIGTPSVVGQDGMPSPAPAPRGPKLKFTSEDDQLLVDLKENKNLTWKQIAEFFPGRSSGTLQVRYCTKLKAKTTQWTDETVSCALSWNHALPETKTNCMDRPLDYRMPCKSTSRIAGGS